MTLKTGVMMLKIQLCITGIIYILKYIKLEFNILIFHNITVVHFLSNKCSIDELEKLL